MSVLGPAAFCSKSYNRRNQLLPKHQSALYCVKQIEFLMKSRYLNGCPTSHIEEFHNYYVASEAVSLSLESK